MEETTTSGESGEQVEQKAQGVSVAAEPKARRLYRSRKNKIIAGVAGGIGEYLGIDPTVVRLVWVIVALAGGAGLVAYIIAWIVIPERPTGEEAPEVPETVSSEVGLIAGLILVGLGVWYLLSNLNLVPPELFAALRIARRALWPLTLILVGVIIIIAASRGGVTIAVRGKTLHRSRTNRRVAGVCGGLGEYLGIDPTLVRLAWVAFTLLSFWAGIVAYIIASIVISEEPA